MKRRVIPVKRRVTIVCVNYVYPDGSHCIPETLEVMDENPGWIELWNEEHLRFRLQKKEEGLVNHSGAIFEIVWDTDPKWVRISERRTWAAFSQDDGVALFNSCGEALRCMRRWRRSGADNVQGPYGPYRR